MKTDQYLDQAKQASGITSDYGLAKVLGVTRQAVSNWRQARTLPDPLICFRLAELLEINAAQVLADIELERAEHSGRVDHASLWREWVEKLGGVAAAVLLGAVLTGPSPAQSRASASSAGDGLYIMSTRRSALEALRDWLTGRGPSPALA